MHAQVRPHGKTAERRLPFECVALVLQCGGAHGAYLAEAGIHPDWIAGLSVGDQRRDRRRQPGQLTAGLALTRGANGFFSARPVTPWLQAARTIEATRFYDTGQLRRTLERPVDFDRPTGTAASSPIRALQWVLDCRPRPWRDGLAFRVDLWSARGDFPATCSRSSRAKRRFLIRAVRAPAPISSSMARESEALSKSCPRT